MAPDIEGLSYMIQFFKDKKSGYLIDVGARDGIKIGTMSHHFIKQGWGGMLIEPLPEAFNQLEDNYLLRSDVITLPFACSDKNGEINLFPFRGVTTVEPEWRDACEAYWDHVKYGKPITVQKRTLKHLLNQYNAPSHVNLLEVDTEGHDLKVLKGMGWEYEPDLVCVEVTDLVHLKQRLKGGKWQPSAELIKYMENLKYTCIKLTCGGNAIFIREGII